MNIHLYHLEALKNWSRKGALCLGRSRSLWYAPRERKAQCAENCRKYYKREWLRESGACVATLSLGSRPRLRGLQGCRPRRRKPGSQSKGIARVRAKRKPGS
jgi:hypothetical protein